MYLATSANPHEQNELTGFPAPSGSTIRILAIVYGRYEIRGQAVYQKLYTAAASGTQFQWSNTFFNNDTWVGVGKTGVIYYKDSAGTL